MRKSILQPRPLLNSIDLYFAYLKLDKPDTCKNIFKEYNDYWYLPEDRTQLFGDALSLLMLEEVSNRVQRGEQIFSTRMIWLTDPLEIPLVLQ